MVEEKVYTIPLGESKKKALVKRTPYAARLVRAFVAQHTKAREVKLGQNLNHELWSRGIEKPPKSVRVTAIIDNGVAKVELFGHKYEEFKPTSVAKREKLTDKLRARLGAKAIKHEEEEKAVEGKVEKKEEIKPEDTSETPAKGK